MYGPDEIEKVKRAFAAALLKTPMDPVRAAASVEPRSAYVNFILANWQFDPDVQEYMRQLREDKGAEAAIPSKEEFAAQLYKDANECRDKSTKLDYMKLFAEVMGFKVKPAETIINNNNTVDNRRVVMMPPPPSIDDWEAAAIESQAKLVNAAS